MESVDSLQRFLDHVAWYETPVPVEAISFLAAGEYNENWRIRHDGRDEVLRVNHGSQLGLVDQIGYEYAVLRAVYPSGVTPQPLRVRSVPYELSGGALLMEYLPGRALAYETDMDAAARVFAAVHGVPLPNDCQLLRQPDPMADIAAESLRLLHRFPDHPLPHVRSRLLRHHENVLRLAEQTRSLFADEPQVIANTEVNSGNFLVHDGVGRLVDWEKAVVTARHQDLAHFLAPTTTLWKTDTVLDAEARFRFLQAYRERLAAHEAPGSPYASSFLPDMDALVYMTESLMRAVLLRGLSWCFMAWQEYASGERPVAHEDTRRTIERYLSEVEWFLR